MDITISLSDAAASKVTTVLIQHNQKNGTAYSIEQFLQRTVMELAIIGDLSLRQPALDADVEQYRSDLYQKETEELIDALTLKP